MKARVDYIVHPSVCGKPSDHAIDVYREIANVVRVDLRYHYSGPVCADHWLDLCRSPEYGHDQLIGDISAELPGVIRAVRESAALEVGVNVVSLGPGDGEIDTRLLACVQGGSSLRRYTAIDVSFELLQHAVGKVVESPNLDQDFEVTALWGDFTKLRKLPARRGKSVNLLSLTGFTLGNHCESNLFRKITPIMGRGDFLFLDARLHPLPPVKLECLTEEQRRLLLKGYRTDPSNRFAFGPVEVVTTATAGDVAFDYEVNQRTTSIANAFNVIMYCRDLDTRMRLNGHSIQLPRLDLARGTTYNFSDLVAWFPRLGFDVVWRGRTDDTGFFLLRRSSGIGQSPSAGSVSVLERVPAD